ncbi:hypothetical protein D3C86_1785170 [compost metagenome]
MRAFQETRQVMGHDIRRGQRFAGVGQQGFGVDVGVDGEQCGGFVRGGHDVQGRVGARIGIRWIRRKL